jgi:alpha-galactosidase
VFVLRTNRRARAVLMLSAAALLGLLFLPARPVARPASALSEGLARTPPMGWNSWNAFRCRIDEQLIRETADALVNTGMRDAGYRYLVIDDCWQTGRDREGLIHASARTFPSGIAALAAYAHERGLMLGIYTSAGRQTCQGRPGSLGFEYQDAAVYAAWGVDFVKVDWCFSEGLDARQQYATWRAALDATGRPMLLSISEWGENAPWDWAPQVGQMWRTTQDIRPEWSSILHNLDVTAWHAGVAGPGRWHDPDMLEVGNGALTLDENRAHFSMWALMAAPLIAGNDLRAMLPEVRDTLTNPEVIAINQDPAGLPGNIVDDTGAGQQVWMKPLADGSRAVALLNRSDAPAAITMHWEKIGLPAGLPASLRDLWGHADLGVFQGAFTAHVPSHGVVLVRVAGALPAVALSDLSPLYASNGFGPPERDQSNGEAGAGDGRPLTLNGQTYPRGLGVHAPFEATYALDGRCARFVADVGVDDEAGTFGAVSFQVWVDGALRADTGPLNGDTPPLRLDVDLGGAQQLRLAVTDGGDWTDYDHADWAGAVLYCSG